MKTNHKEIQMKKANLFLTALMILTASGCGFTLGSTKASQTMEHEDELGRVSRTTYTSEGSGKEIHGAGSAGAMVLMAGRNADGNPVMHGAGYQFGPQAGQMAGMPGYGYGGAPGYGYGGVGAAGMAPANVPIVVTTPVLVGAQGPGGFGGGYGSSSSLSVSERTQTVRGGNTDPQTERRLATVERDVAAAKNGVTRLTVAEMRKSCREFLKDPTQVKDEAKRKEQTEACNKLVEGGK